jgi:hypothetical protein
LLDEGDQYKAVQHGHTAQGDKAYRGAHRKGHATNREGQDAADVERERAELDSAE